MAILWKESLATGVSIIDEQHKELFNRINSMLEACMHGLGKEKAEEVIKFLEEYVETHFSTEEKMQKKYDYPLADDHKEQHKIFVANFNDIKQKLEKDGNGPRIVQVINRLVVDWLINHIGNKDKAFAVFLREKNINV